MDNPLSPQEAKQKMEEELSRLQDKRKGVVDADILGALNQRIQDLEHQISHIQIPTKEANEEEEVEVPPPPTPEQSEVAERLIREARVAKMRGQAEESRRLLAEARVAAPGSTAVLELLGDEFGEAGQKNKALECYRMAMKLNPGNVALEKKHAYLVFNLKAKPQTELSSLSLSAAEVQMNIRGARLRSVLLPGLGQVSLGQLGLGYTLMGIWAVCILWLAIKMPDIEQFLKHLMKPQASQNDISFFFPLVVALGVHLISIGLSSTSSSTSEKSASVVERPKPPVNLPFD